MNFDFLSDLLECSVTDKDSIRNIINTIPEERTITIMKSLIEGNYLWEFVFLVCNGCLLTTDVVETIVQFIQIHNRDKFKEEISRYGVYNDLYNNFDVRVGRFALCYGSLKSLTNSKIAFHKIMKDKILHTKFDPLLWLIRWNDREVFEYVMKIKPIKLEDKEDYLEVAKTYNSTNLYSLLE